MGGGRRLAKDGHPDFVSLGLDATKPLGHTRRENCRGLEDDLPWDFR